MSAEDLGRRLAGEVKVQRLDELLTTLSLLQNPTPKTFDVSPLDRLISIFKHQSKSGISNQNPPIIEITSPTPSQGPQKLLYHITSTSILPSTLGGNLGCICLLDPDSTFSLPDLITHLHHLLKTHNPTIPTSETVATIQESLNHLHIFRPQGLQSLTETLTTLPSYFLQTPPAHQLSRNRHVAAILLTSPSPFHSLDRSAVASGSPSRFPALAAALKVASVKLRAPVVFTTWNVAPTTTTTTTTTYTASAAAPTTAATAAVNTQGDFSIKPQLPGPWTTLPNLRLVVQKKKKRKYARGICVEDLVRGNTGSGAQSGSGKQGIEGEGTEKEGKGWERTEWEVRVNGFGAAEWGDGVGVALRESDGFLMRDEGEGVVVGEG